MSTNEPLELVVSAVKTTCQRLKIPSDMISLHSDLRYAKRPDGKTLQGKGQHTLRWGAFLLTYAALEGFFNEICKSPNTRILPLNADKIRDAIKRDYELTLFTREWGVRTLIPSKSQDDGLFCEWRVYRGGDVRMYLNDMKWLRDRLTHGGDPFSTKNDSGALWATNKGPSLRMMGVDGFLQASCDLVDQTIVAFGGTSEDLPDWPVDTCRQLSEQIPTLGPLQRSNR
ncbi:hypothetical protein [Arthrobacter sp. H35-D1]|uniref:hypothetical protein n=1 Tax=Arthrobacter sp. H35-D1 TaxID=3046202 RepID=UPI0024B8CFC0|nr:hypothetical protein [Arthrobacter sp. H35-D1]MDJ0314553.1 hypothetical protein [Arthrobacter sp. H35-D1]